MDHRTLYVLQKRANIDENVRTNEQLKVFSLSANSHLRMFKIYSEQESNDSITIDTGAHCNLKGHKDGKENLF